MTSARWGFGRIFSREYNFFRPAYWLGEVDARSLSLFRIFFAGLLLKNAFYLLFIADEFYSDTGVLPRDVLWTITPNSRFSLMDAMPQTWMVQIFLGVWMIVLVGLLLGYRTRTMSILNFIILVSVHERNFLILNGADLAMRVLSFWAMFIPLGTTYAIDSLRHRWHIFRITRNTADLQPPSTPPMIFALPVRLIQIQIALIYVFTFILKLEGKPWRDGTALYYALQVQSLVLPSGTWLLENAPLWVFKVGSYFALVMEGGFVFLVFLPIFQPMLRALGLLLGVMMHLGIAVLMSIHDFSLVMMIGYLTFWDARWVDFLDRSLRLRPLSLWLPLPAGDNPAWLLLGLAEGKQLHLSDNPAQSGWFVKDANEQKYMGTDAWNKIAEHLPLSRLWGWAVMRSLLRGGLRLAGKWTLRNPVTQPMISQQPTAIPSLSRLVWLGRVLLSIPLLALTSLIIWMNVTTVGNNGQISLTGTPREVVRYLSMKQSWGMFAPYPTDQDGWITVPAQFENGLEIDLMTGKPLSNKMTQYHWGPAMRWKKYTAEIWKSGVQPLLKAWGDYFCYRYNVEDKLPKGERLASLKIYYNWRWSHTPGEEPNDLIHTRLRQHSCL